MRGRQGVRVRDVKMFCHECQRRKEGRWVEEGRQPPEVGKGKGVDCFLEPPEETLPSEFVDV